MRTGKIGFPALWLAALLLFCGMAPAGPANVSVFMTEPDWNSIDPTRCGFTSRQQLLDEAADYAAAIAAMTGRDDWMDFYGTEDVTIEIAFTERTSHVEGAYTSYAAKIPKLYINRSVAEHDFWPLAHELTHLICPEYSSLSLREGLASYMQDTVGQNPSVFNYGLDVHALAYLLLKDSPDVISLMGSGDFPKSAAAATGGKRAAFYLCSYSFSKYLIETYGMAPFMELYESGNIAKTCRLAFGHDMDRLVDGWMQYLYDYPAKLTQNEIDRALKEIWALHGLSVQP